MILNEETFDILNFDVPDVTNADIEVADIDATVPEAGPEVGVETLLMQAIKDIYGMIEGYNSLSIALTDIGNESAAISVADIIRMEHSNIGALQDILAEISPNAEAVDINESLKEVYKKASKKLNESTNLKEIKETIKYALMDNFDVNDKYPVPIWNVDFTTKQYGDREIIDTIKIDFQPVLNDYGKDKNKVKKMFFQYLKKDIEDLDFEDDSIIKATQINSDDNHIIFKINYPGLKPIKPTSSINDFKDLKKVIRKIIGGGIGRDGDTTIDPDFTTIDIIDGKQCYCIYACGYEDEWVEYVSHELEDEYGNYVEIFEVNLEEDELDKINKEKLPKEAKKSIEKYGELDGYYKCIALKNNINESLNERLDDIGSKGYIYRNDNKVGEYWYSYVASSYGFNLINGETHHWYSKEDFLDFLKEHDYTTKRI